MDFAYSDEQQALRELARKILEDLASPERLRQVEGSEERIDRELWSELAKANLLGAALPESYGGSGFGFFELCLLLEEVGRAVAPVPAWATLVLGALPIAEFGSEAQREHWLPRVVAGEVLLTGALSEPGSVDPLSMATEARRDGDVWRLSGVKTCVAAATVAERVVVPARGPAGPGLFLLDPRTAGVTVEAQYATSREILGHITLDDAEAELLVAPEAGGEALRAWVERAIVALCAVELGVADRALRITADYASERCQFDRPIGSFQAVHQRAADAYVDVETMRLTLWNAAFQLGRGASAPEAVAVAKFFASEAGHAVTYAAMHLHGGIGSDVDYPVHRYYLWSRQIELTLGPAEAQLAALGDLLAETKDA